MLPGLALGGALQECRRRGRPPQPLILGSTTHARAARVRDRVRRELPPDCPDAGRHTMFYDVGQGQGWQRDIVMYGSPHLPAGIRQWYGDSRGHWEGNTLVVDVTNFSPKTDYQGSRENLH